MKIRNGFVSNSSSSSFICDFCGRVESGMDMGLTDAEMYTCELGHTFCDDHCEAITIKDKRDYLINGITDKVEIKRLSDMSDDEIEDYFDDYDYEFRGNIPSKFCPICNFNEMPDSDLVKYLLIDRGYMRDRAIKKIKERFQDYKTFKMFIGEKHED